MMNKRKGSRDLSLPSLQMTESAGAQHQRRIDVPARRRGPDHLRAPEVYSATLEDLDDVWQLLSPYFHITQQLRQREDVWVGQTWGDTSVESYRCALLSVSLDKKLTEQTKRRLLWLKKKLEFKFDQNFIFMFL